MVAQKKESNITINFLVLQPHDHCELFAFMKSLLKISHEQYCVLLKISSLLYHAFYIPHRQPNASLLAQHYLLHTPSFS